MRIYCKYCGSKSIVTKHTRPSTTSEDVYCDCTNPDCGARFKARIIYTHTLTPPIGTLQNSLAEQIAQLDPEERRKLLQTYAR